MRGGDGFSGELFSYVDLEKRVRGDHPFAGDPGDRQRGAVGAGAGFCGALCADRAAVDSAGEAASGDAFAGVLFDPLGTAVDGATGIRPPVPVVRRHRGR